MKRILSLNLKKKWFDLILSGVKTEEYREIKDYWARRLLMFNEELEPGDLDEVIEDMNKPFLRHNGPADLMQYFGVKFKEFGAVCFKNGYAKDSPAMTFRVNGISVKTGKEEWGAEFGKFYFVIDIGDRVLYPEI